MFRWQQFSSAATIWPGRSSRPAAACDALRKFSRQQSRARRRVVGDSASVNAATVALVRRSRLEAVLFVAGIQAWSRRHWQWAAAVMLLFLFTLFVYTAVFVEVPYYSGLTAHTESGNVRAYRPHIEDFGVMTTRLLRYYNSVPIFVPWVLIACVAIFAAARIQQVFRDDAECSD